MKLSPVDWDLADQRWRDMAAQPYAAARKASYGYAQADVALDRAPSGATLRGTLTASGLKPNFAYQLKLNGKPSRLFGDEGDDQANERLGLLGRWWARQIRLDDGAVVRHWRSNDKEYAGWKFRRFHDAEHDVVFEGYLLFDYLVTDANGNARLDIALDSSFHVLFKTSQRPPKPNDSTPTAHQVLATAASGWYDEDLPPRPVELYAEWEPTRALPGQLVLPPGDYRCQLFLTEETFHEREPDSGTWPTVLAAPDLTPLALLRSTLPCG